MTIKSVYRHDFSFARCVHSACFLSLITCGFTFTSAHAQGIEETGTIEEIVSLGSRSTKERTSMDSAVPIDVIGADALTAFGQTETSRMLQFAAPSFNFSTSTVSDGSDIVRPATLRGMQPDQTLVLVNGKRRHSSALMHVNGSVGRGAAGVDLNAIPASSIARIEVLRDGAAAQYGSDAIAGVINVVLKDQTETIDPYVQFGSTYNGDGDQQVASVNAGFPLFGDGYINLTGEYRNRDATDHSGRDPRQIYNFEEQVFGQPQLAAGTLPAEEASFDRRNHRYGDPDSENWYLSWNAGMPVFGDAEVYTFGGYADRDGESGGFYRREYDGRDLPAIHPGGFLPLINTDVTDFSAGLGLKGELFGWGYDASAVYGENEFEFAIADSLNVSLGNATPTSADAGTLKSDQIVLNLDFVNEFDMVGLDDVSTAFGFEWRQDGYEIQAGQPSSYVNGPDDDPNTAPTNQYGGPSAPGIQVFPGFRPSNEVDQDRDSWAIYGDLEADITDRWLLGFALRYEDYDDFGNTTNLKVSSRYFVVDNLAIRAAVSTGFRAPSLNQQFFNNVSTQFVTVGGVANVPTDVATLRNDSAAVRNGFGVPELTEEESTNLSAGFTWQPNDAFSLTADAYYIDVDDRVVLSGRFNKETIGNDGLPCDGDPNPATSNCPIQAILPVEVNSAQFFSNAIDTETSGIDLIMAYAFEYGSGQFNLTGAFNWNNVSVDEIRIPDGLINSPGAAGTLYSRQEVTWMESGQPEEHWILTGTYDRGPLSLLLRGNWFGEVKSTESPNAACEVPDTCLDQTFSGKWLVDVRAGWSFTDDLLLTVGVDNVFDAQPDTQTSETDFNGIFPYSRRTTPFGFNGGFYYASLNWSFGHGLN
jgi:iron complex outermembrane receptor protein